jgi:tetratricopeptide (TPR) repeat protein
MRALPTAGEQAGSASEGMPGETPGASCRRLRFSLVHRRWKLLVLLVLLVALTAGAGVAARPHIQAWYHRRAARAELQRYHTGQAIRHLLLCRDIWPRDPETLVLSARAARRAQVYGDSELLLRIYREVRGRDDAYTLEQLALAAECRVDEVSEQCWKCIEEGRFDGPLLMEALARGYLRQFRLGQARMCLDHWKQMQPDNPQVFFLEGLLNLDYLHVSSDGVASYRRAVELDADYEEARVGLAVALLTDKKYAEAAEQFKRLLQSQPDNARVQVGLAECLDSLGETVEAAQIVDDVLARQPQLSPALSLRGQLALKNGQWSEAESSLRQALESNPLEHRARYGLIRCLEQTGKEEAAEQQRRQLQQLEQDTARFHEIVTKEIAKRPTDPVLHFTLGQILLRSGQREEGIRWLQSALHLDPNYAPARQALAEHRGQAKGETQPRSP